MTPHPHTHTHTHTHKDKMLNILKYYAYKYLLAYLNMFFFSRQKVSYTLVNSFKCIKSNFISNLCVCVCLFTLMTMTFTVLANQN